MAPLWLLSDDVDGEVVAERLKLYDFDFNRRGARAVCFENPRIT